MDVFKILVSENQIALEDLSKENLLKIVTKQGKQILQYKNINETHRKTIESNKTQIHDLQKNKTIITYQKSQVPLFLQKALYYDETIPPMAHLFILSPSGGILQGDRYRTDITLSNNAICHITTQGATRIYKMDSKSNKSSRKHSTGSEHTMLVEDALND